MQTSSEERLLYEKCDPSRCFSVCSLWFNTPPSVKPGAFLICTELKSAAKHPMPRAVSCPYFICGLPKENISIMDIFISMSRAICSAFFASLPLLWAFYCSADATQ